MKSRAIKVAKTLERKRINKCSVQKTCKKGESAKMLSGGAVDINWSGKGAYRISVLVSEEFVNNVVEMELVSAWLVIVTLVIGKSLVNVISNVPQIGRSAEENDNFEGCCF